MSLTEITLTLIQYLHSLGAGFQTALQLLANVERGQIQLFLMPVILWSLDYTLGLRLGSISLISNGINGIAKIGLHSPRPGWVSEAIKPVGASPRSFGMPSGHAQNSTVIYGFLATQICKRWFQFAMIMLILLVGFSRVAFGVHFIQDVLLGWIVGVLILLIYLWLEGPIVAWTLDRPRIQQYLLVLLSGLLMAMLGWLTLAATQNWVLPEEWSQLGGRFIPADAVPNPRNPDTILTSAGLITGLWWGFLWLQSRGGYSADGPWWQRLLRFPVGLLGVWLLWSGLGSVLPSSPDVIGDSLQFIHYALLGFWISGLGPWVFQRLKLSDN